MARFFVRVELPGKPAADYAGLHRDMRSAGYRRVVEGSKADWHLPHGEYTCRADGWTAVEIRDEVSDIARKHHGGPRVFATRSSAWASSGLRKVTEDDPEPDDE